MANSLNSSGLPIGTILTVPKKTELEEGWIEFIPNSTYSGSIYPELYEILETEIFRAVDTSMEYSELPVGTMVYTLSNETPRNWVEFNSNNIGVLAGYPELKNLLRNMIVYIPSDAEDIRTAWNNALDMDTFPNLEGNGFFLRTVSQTNIDTAKVGQYLSDSAKVNSFNILPAVVDYSNTLNPRGYSREPYKNMVQPIVSGTEVNNSTQHTEYVLVAHRAENYEELENNQPWAFDSQPPEGWNNSNISTHRINITDLDETLVNETAPKSLSARLLVKAATQASVNLPSTHKQIIRAF